MSLLGSAIELLAPPQCINCGEEGAALCLTCAAEMIIPFGERCWRCNSLSVNCRTCQTCRRQGSPAYVWIATNHDNLARDLLSLYKFGHQRAAAGPIAQMMGDVFQKYGGGEYLVVPVPTATSRIRERGFGHAELLAKKVALQLSLPYEFGLRRLGQARQLGSTRENRLKQLDSSFAVKDPLKISGKNILLVDDVVTTGGTIIAAVKALRAAGAKQVAALLFAKRL